MHFTGLIAAKCIWSDLRNVEDRKARIRLYKRLWNIGMIWLLVYIFIGIPLWCEKGWCCCCCRFRFCRPREIIDEAKRFYVMNPPGTFHDANNQVIRYQPTKYEEITQQKLKQAILHV